MNRLAFNKKEGDFTKIDQQHLSNCWWFVKVFGDHEDEKVTFTLEQIKRQLVDRFNGQLMSYRPHTANKSEIELLETSGMLVRRWEEHQAWDIIWDNKKIGKIRSTF